MSETDRPPKPRKKAERKPRAAQRRASNTRPLSILMVASEAQPFSKTGGLTNGTIGSGTGTNAALLAKHTSCKAEKPVRPSVHLVVHGEVDAVSPTSITVKPRDGSAAQTCAVKDADDVRRLEKGDRVELTCVQVAGAWTLAKVRRR